MEIDLCVQSFQLRAASAGGLDGGNLLLQMNHRGSQRFPLLKNAQLPLEPIDAPVLDEQRRE
jgi:hypothetical protein